MNVFSSFALVVLAFLAVSRGDTESDGKLSSAANCFTLNFYKLLATKPENLVCSPFSLDVLLSMLYVGSGGQTAVELKNTLGYQGLSIDSLEESFKTKLGQLKSSENNTLEVANSVWLQQDFNILENYKEAVKKYFLSEITNVNFAGNAHEATAKINSWGKDKTHGLIPSLFDKDLEASTIMVLVNAIYFKGNWQYKFEKTQTRDGQFYTNGDSNSGTTVKLMHQRGKFTYHQDTSLNAQVLEMDYVGNDMSMVLILPQSGKSLEDVQKVITCDTFKTTLSSGYKTLVDLTMPKFNIESSFDLVPPIKASGIKTAFARSANFSGVTPSNVHVSKAIQKAIIKVYEEGSEAAVLTGISVVKTAVVSRDPEPIYFRADRPFIFLIRHKPSDLVLFLGKVTLPKLS